MTGTSDSERSNGDREMHLAVLRRLIGGRWDELRAMSLDRLSGDESFCHFVIGEHLTYFVLGRLEAANQTSVLPQPWIERLRARARQFQDARTQLKGKLVEAAGAMFAAGLDFRVLKGIPFAQKYMGDINLRRWADIDLLVHEADADRALGVLWGLGYREMERGVRMTASGPTIAPSFVRSEHEVTAEHANVQIDLHWRFRTAPAYRWRDEQIWAGTPDVTVEGTSYPVLPDEYALVLLLVSTAHDIAHGGCRLKHLLDVHQLLSCRDVTLDYAGFLENRLAENTQKICVNMLRMMLDLLAEEEEFPVLREALSRYDSLLARGSGRARADELARSPRGGVENKLWFAEVYGVRWQRDLAWIISRSLRDPARLPQAAWRVAQLGARRVGGLARRSVGAFG